MATTRIVLAAATFAGLAAGAALYVAGEHSLASDVWAATTAVALVPLAAGVVRAVRHGDVGVDAIALVAMAGALVLGEELAGAVIAVMLAGGNALEALASGRARRALEALLARAPRTAHRLRDGSLEEVDVDAIVPGDVVIVRAGEVLPVDGAVGAGGALVDESALTGEALAVPLDAGADARSGTVNAGDAFELRAVRPAAESAYAQVVRLVRQAEASHAPLVRLADRYAAAMLPAVLVTAAVAWIASGDPHRALAVLVVATPCPLILAAPIALIAGVSRAARAGIIVKGSAAIERLGRARSVLFDKTGTLTVGEPALQRIIALDGVAPAELLRLAASLDQLSTHPVAAALTTAARERGVTLSVPEAASETHGQGMVGRVDGRAVVLGGAGFVSGHGHPDAEAVAQELEEHEAALAHVLVGVDDELAGALVLGDDVRPGARQAIADLRRVGVRYVGLATGDRLVLAGQVAERVGVDAVFAGLTPEGKVDLVRGLQRRPELRPVVMVGDGVNDAPALALADVGIALADRGVTVSSEAADAVIGDGRVERVVDAVRIGQRSLGIARQSILVGLGLSAAAMIVAAGGLIPPVWGALLQEGIDVLVILNALRALRG